MTDQTTYPTSDEKAAVPAEAAAIATRLLDECVSAHIDEADAEGDDYSAPHPISIESDARVIAAAVGPHYAAAAREAMADTLKAEADSIRKSAGEFIGDDLLAYVQGIEYSVDRLRGAPQVEVEATR